MQVLNKHEKERLVIKMHLDGRTMRDIASSAHLSFGDIKKIIERIDGDNNSDINLSNKSKTTRAMFLFKSGKKPIDVAIELDIPSTEIEDILQEYWVLNQLDDLALAYYEIRQHFDLFLELFYALKKNRSINQKDIGNLLRYATYDLPSLESRIQRLTSDVIYFEQKKKQSADEVTILSSSVSQLRKSLDWCKTLIEEKIEIISNLDRQLNQKIYTESQK
jgi:hypothetical protein